MTKPTRRKKHPLYPACKNREGRSRDLLLNTCTKLNRGNAFIEFDIRAHKQPRKLISPLSLRDCSANQIFTLSIHNSDISIYFLSLPSNFYCGNQKTEYAKNQLFPNLQTFVRTYFGFATISIGMNHENPMTLL